MKLKTNIHKQSFASRFTKFTVSNVIFLYFRITNQFVHYTFKCETKGKRSLKDNVVISVPECPFYNIFIEFDKDIFFKKFIGIPMEKKYSVKTQI